MLNRHWKYLSSEGHSFEEIEWQLNLNKEELLFFLDTFSDIFVVIQHESVPSFPKEPQEDIDSDPIRSETPHLMQSSLF